MSSTNPSLALKTPLHALHVELGAKMAPFAGYEMPVQFELGVLREHLHTRESAGLFDVSHMGQIFVRSRSADGGVVEVAAALESLLCANIVGLGVGRQRYALLTNERGGIIDDLMVANLGDRIALVVNAACKHADLAHLRAHLDSQCEFTLAEDRAMVALQGPLAAVVLADLGAHVDDLKFMDVRERELLGAHAIITRAGYTGEDGFEISLREEDAEPFARTLLGDERVCSVGLGARDSLRLDAGLCLYGSDIGNETTPVEANLRWAIGAARRSGGAREGGFPGAARVLAQLSDGSEGQERPARQRVGLRPQGRAPVRAGTPLFAADDSSEEGAEAVGNVTSGSFSPSVAAPVAMGYVASSLAAPGKLLSAEVRGKRLSVEVTTLPFVDHRYAR